ncbi:MAG: Do family serine endopeptidase [Hyphomicrobiaceae bacterium]
MAALPIVAPLSPARAETVGPQSVAPIAERLLDAVVNISTSQTLKGPEGIPLPKVPEGSPFEEFFKEFFDGRGDARGPQQVSSLGSGFVVDPSGLIVTNNHVIADADEIFVSFNDGTRLKVDKVVGRDTKTDIALLKVTPAHPLTAVTFGDSGRMHVGDWVMAIGNPFGLGGTVTVGIISAKKRDINSGPYDEFLQTDAAINKGNSGGPLFDMAGEVIGINTAIISPSGGSIGIGFAVPSSTVVNVVEQLKLHGEVRRGWIGVAIQSITPEIAESLGLSGTGGVLVSAVAPDSPGAAAGLRAGDLILTFDGQDIDRMRGLARVVALTPVGRVVKVGILRAGESMSLDVTVGHLTASLTDTEAGEPQFEEEPGPEPTISALGLTLGGLTEETRAQFGIADTVEGVLVLEVDPDSEAATKGIHPGDVIGEVTNQKVASPDAFVRRLAEIGSSGRQSALLMVLDAAGGIRFIALPVGAG